MAPDYLSLWQWIWFKCDWEDQVLQARVSWPSFASLNPQAWRSMWGWIGNGILAASPTRWMRRWKPMGLIGPPRDQPEDRESSRARGAADTARRADELIE
jgi:hypothetical protein